MKIKIRLILMIMKYDAEDLIALLDQIMIVEK